MSWAHVDRVLSKQGGSVLARLPNDMAEVLRRGFVMVCAGLAPRGTLHCDRRPGAR